PLRLIAELPRDLNGLTDVRFAQIGAHRRRDRQEPGAQFTVVRITLASEAHEFRSTMLRIIDELHKPLGRQLVRQTLHPLAASRSHLSDLRHGNGANERQAAHESKRTAAPVGYEPCSLTKGPQTKEELRHFEHQLRDRRALASADPTGPFPMSNRGHPVVLRVLRSVIDTAGVSVWHNDTQVVTYEFHQPTAA